MQNFFSAIYDAFWNTIIAPILGLTFTLVIVFFVVKVFS